MADLCGFAAPLNAALLGFTTSSTPRLPAVEFDHTRIRMSQVAWQLSDGLRTSA